MNNTNQQKIAIAKDFVERHRINGVTAWQPFFDDSDKQYLAIYHSMAEGNYGETHNAPDGDLQIEIGSHDAANGISQYFEFPRL